MIFNMAKKEVSNMYFAIWLVLLPVAGFLREQ
jgi:hypothetical protein